MSKRFLGELDLGTDEIAKAVMEFMPFSFNLVGKMSEKFKESERRYNYTTPKTFLELIKLYKNLASKREVTEGQIDRLENGLEKLMKTQKDVDILVEQAKIKAVEVADKVASPRRSRLRSRLRRTRRTLRTRRLRLRLKSVRLSKSRCWPSRYPCRLILMRRSRWSMLRSQRSIPSTRRISRGKVSEEAPAGVDITAVVVILLQNNPRDKSWNAATKMMNNVERFMETLKGFKDQIDAGKVPKKNVDACRPYLELPHFNRDTIYNKSRAAAGLCEFAINIIKYYDVITMIELKRKELADANAQLDEANATLQAVQDKVAGLNALVADLNASSTRLRRTRMPPSTKRRGSRSSSAWPRVS